MAVRTGVRRRWIRRRGCATSAGLAVGDELAGERSLGPQARSFQSDDSNASRSDARCAVVFARITPTTNTASCADTTRWNRRVPADATTTTRSPRRGQFTALAAGNHFMASRKRSSKKAAAKGREEGRKEAQEVAQSTPSRRRSREAVKSAKKKIARPKPVAVRAAKRPAFNPKTDSANDPNMDRARLGRRAAARRARLDRRRHARGAAARAGDRRDGDADLHEDGQPVGRARVSRTMNAGVSRRRSTTRAFARRSRTIRISSISRVRIEALRRRSIESFVAELAAMRGARAHVSRLASRQLHRRSRERHSSKRRRDHRGAVARAGSHDALHGDDGGERHRDRRDVRGSRRAHRRDSGAVRSRVGVCVDTCHVYSAGYDLAHAYDDVWARFDDVLGMSRLRSCISTTRRRRSLRAATATS